VSFDARAVQRDVPLARRTTLELGGAATRFYEASSEDDLLGALAYARSEGLRVHVLAGGSNVIVPDAGVDGLVLAPRLRGLTPREDDDTLTLRVGAGELWDEVVAFAVSRGAAGIECLSGIPGWAGATPIQNVGAYGQEVSDVLTHVHVIDRRTLVRSDILARDCAFGYRDSRFKRSPEEFLVTGITLSLPLAPPRRPTYAELSRALPEALTAQVIRETVIALRRAKSMVWDLEDPNHRSAGSFFTNPVVPSAVADHVVAIAMERGLVREAHEVPRHPAGAGMHKLAAAWLIERSGFARGTREGAVGISSAHTLALVHHGGGSTAVLLAFAERVRDAVAQSFGVTLEREPVLFGHP
jgi:UDP-N-acetylmuramate dehydrogenase